MTANDGALGEQHLRDFRDNEKTIPTILTTSQKLSTGVDARNVRNIVLLRPINSMIEFKQIIGRGTRFYDGKDYFTIHDHQWFRIGASASRVLPTICMCEGPPAASAMSVSCVARSGIDPLVWIWRSQAGGHMDP